MLKYIPNTHIAQIDVDVVRLNDERTAVLLSECKSDKGSELAAFLVQYDLTTVIYMHKGTAEQHQAFCNHLNTLM